jgi:hypothetical protein
LSAQAVIIKFHSSHLFLSVLEAQDQGIGWFIPAEDLSWLIDGYLLSERGGGREREREREGEGEGEGERPIRPLIAS